MSPNAANTALKELDRLESLRESSHAEKAQRLFRRYVTRGDAELRPMERAQTEHAPVEVKVRDISRGGIGFICEQPLPENSIWELRVIQGGFATTTAPIVVRHCRQVNHHLHLAGAQFVASTAMMLAMGVDPAVLHDDENRGASGDDESFVSPDDVG